MYMPHSSGWSKPVWNLLATSRIWYSSEPKASRILRPRRLGFSVALFSVKGSGPEAGSFTSSEKATSVPIL